jgi:hypothetical protein
MDIYLVMLIECDVSYGAPSISQKVVFSSAEEGKAYVVEQEGKLSDLFWEGSDDEWRCVVDLHYRERTWTIHRMSVVGSI